MRKIYASLLVVGLLGTALIGTTSGNGPGSGSFGPTRRFSASAGSHQAQVTGLQLLFRGQPVDQLVSGKKIKKYSLQVTGTGFRPGSSVGVNSLRAYPVTIGEPPQQSVSTDYVSATNLEAAFLPGIGPPPGFLTVKVVNPDGAESNAVTLDVISNPAELSITSISPESGPVGTRVTLTGVGFMPAGAPNQVAIRFSPVGSNETLFEGFYTDSIVDNGKLNLVVPNRVILPICPGGQVGCDPLAIPPVIPQQYRVWVINPNGMSNNFLFSVTSS